MSLVTTFMFDPGETADELREGERGQDPSAKTGTPTGCWRAAAGFCSVMLPARLASCRTADGQAAAASALSSSSSSAIAASMSARWVNACGKLPSCSPDGPISSAKRPTWLA